MAAPVDDALEALLARARAGDQEALTELLGRLGPALRRSIKIAPAWQSALSDDDVVQITFTEAFLRIHQFAGDNVATFGFWLSRIAQNAIRAAIRAMNAGNRPPPGRRLAAQTAGKTDADPLQILGVTSNTPSRFAAKDEAGKILDQAMKQLPEDYAAAINLYYFQGIRGEELGERLSRSRGAAFMLLARARALLAEYMGTPSQFFTDSP